MTPYEFGKRAFANGLKPAPVLDKAFMATLQNGPIGTNLPALEEWNRGWHEANAAQIVPGLEDIPVHLTEDGKLPAYVTAMHLAALSGDDSELPEDFWDNWKEEMKEGRI